MNRIDDTIVFTPLSKKEVAGILELQLQELQDRLVEKNLTITVKPSAKEYLVDHGYDPTFGARPMRRLIQREIEDQLALRLIEEAANNSQQGIGRIVVSLVKDKLKVSLKRELPEVSENLSLPMEMEPINL